MNTAHKPKKKLITSVLGATVAAAAVPARTVRGRDAQVSLTAPGTWPPTSNQGDCLVVLRHAAPRTWEKPAAGVRTASRPAPPAVVYPLTVSAWPFASLSPHVMALESGPQPTPTRVICLLRRDGGNGTLAFDPRELTS
jgi:hypothetical protein